jgi:hypothetical protein
MFVDGKRNKQTIFKDLFFRQTPEMSLTTLEILLKDFIETWVWKEQQDDHFKGLHELTTKSGNPLLGGGKGNKVAISNRLFKKQVY